MEKQKFERKMYKTCETKSVSVPENKEEFFGYKTMAGYEDYNPPKRAPRKRLNMVV